MKKSLLFSIFTISYLLFTPAVFADVSCQPIYGGGQTCTTSANILINKTVQNPVSGQFVDNLGISDPRFSQNQTVTFNVTVKNTGNNAIDKTIVKDALPQFVTFKSGAGNFDANTKTLAFEVDNLAVGESRTFPIQVTVVDQNQLSSSSSINCVVNQSSAQIVSNGQTSTDNAQFCIEKKVQVATTKGGLPVLAAPQMTTTPATGPEMLPLFGLIPAGGLGFFLRRKSSKNFQGDKK
jgi:uncharacterized repeat protein (TIGR01451 family)